MSIINNNIQMSYYNPLLPHYLSLDNNQSISQNIITLPMNKYGQIYYTNYKIPIRQTLSPINTFSHNFISPQKKIIPIFPPTKNIYYSPDYLRNTSNLSYFQDNVLSKKEGKDIF